MSEEEKDTASPLAEMQGDPPLDAEEIATLRKRAWIEQGILVVSPDQDRVSKQDARTLFSIAEALYGKEDS